MNYWSTSDVAFIITTVVTGICSIIAAMKATSAAKSGHESNTKLNDAKIKLEKVEKTTNGNLTKLEEQCLDLKQGNRYLRALVIELIKVSPKDSIDDAIQKVNKKGYLKKQLTESPTYSFREEKDGGK